MNTDTPETDAQHLHFPIGKFTLNFCRKLKRERDEARRLAERFATGHDVTFFWENSQADAPWEVESSDLF